MRFFWGLLWSALLLLATARIGRSAEGTLELNVVDRATQEPLTVRMHLKNAAGKPVQPPKTPFYHDHFVFHDRISLKLPVGNYSFEIERGLEYLWRAGTFSIQDSAADTKTIDLKRFCDMPKEGWWGGDLDVRRPLEQMEILMRAEDLRVAPVTTWWNGKSDLKSKIPADKLLTKFDETRFFHGLGCGLSRPEGTLLLLGGAEPPDWKNPTNDFPTNLQWALAARQKDVWVDVQRPFDWDLPILAAHNAIDSVETHNRQQGREFVLDHENGGKARNKTMFAGSTGNGRWSQAIYYHLLNCGLRIPPSAGSGTGAVGNPLGYNRTYVYLKDDFSYNRWWTSFKAGHVMVTNGPLLRVSVEGEPPGHVFTSSQDPLSLEIGLTLSVRSPDRISYVEVIKDGEVKISQRLDEFVKNQGQLPKLAFDKSGWFIVRAVCDTGKTYRHAMTAPYYVEIGEPKRRISKASAQFFVAWIKERLQQVKVADETARQVIMQEHETALAFFENLARTANAE